MRSATPSSADTALRKRLWLRIAAGVLAVAVLIPDLIHSLHFVSEPGRVTGWEAAWIAQSIVDGHGFSFPEVHRWLFVHSDTGRYFPTAWVDPIYTYCLAALMVLFGPAHVLAAVWLNAIFLLGAFAFLYLSAERWFSPYAGIVVIALMGLSHVWLEALDDQNNTCLATLLLSVCLWQSLRLFERPSARRAATLGVLLGFTALGCPSTLLLTAATALVVVTASRDVFPHRWRNAALICICAALAMLPWTVRNYEIFGKVIPVRDGSGMLAFVGTMSLASVVHPDELPTRAQVTWHVDTIRAAVNLAQARDERRALEQFPMDYLREVNPEGFANLDEAERDAWLGAQAQRYARAHPKFVALAAVPKLELFLRVLGGGGRITLLIAVLTVVFAFRDVRVRLAGAWIAAFVSPFGLIICYFDRYRAPVEPIVMLLALWGLWHAGAALRVRFSNASDLKAADREPS